MPRYKLTIAYDGTDFHGWQKQEPPAPPNAIPPEAAAAAQDALGMAPLPSRVPLRTVQGVVEQAVREVVREPVILMGASRTDAGVHARGQVAAFTCSGDEDSVMGILPVTPLPPSSPRGTGVPPVSPAPSRPPSSSSQDLTQNPAPPRGQGWPLSRGPDRLLRAINSRLPDDVLILSAEPAAPHFNPIAHAAAKGYSYTLHTTDHNRSHRPLWDRRFVQHVWVPLDLARMNDAAARLVGEHDFAAFAAAGHGRLSTVRTVFTCTVADITADPQDPADAARRLRIDISGNGFLWNMVRIIAGTLVEVGRGRLSPDDVTAAIQSGDRRKAGPTLPARGLCLEWIRYS